MITNSYSKIFRFTVRTTGLYLSGSAAFDTSNLILQYKAGNSDWTTLRKGSTEVVLQGSGTVLKNLTTSESFAENNIPVEEFKGIPGKGEENLDIAVLVSDMNTLGGSLDYRIIAKACPDCWEFFMNSDYPERALPEPIEESPFCAVVSTGSLYPTNE